MALVSPFRTVHIGQSLLQVPGHGFKPKGLERMSLIQVWSMSRVPL